jgi:hypothetical protein
MISAIITETTSPTLPETTPGPPVSDPVIYIAIVCGIIVVVLTGSWVYARISRKWHVSEQVRRWNISTVFTIDKEELLETNLPLNTPAGGLFRDVKIVTIPT